MFVAGILSTVYRACGEATSDDCAGTGAFGGSRDFVC